METPPWPQDSASSSAPVTMPTSRSGSPSRLLLPKVRKKVNWDVPDERPTSYFSIKRTQSSTVDEEGATGREEQIEELRRQLTRDLPQNHPSNHRDVVSRPKPVLRRGDQTPPSGLVSPLSEPYDFISDRDNKNRSAEDAQERALQVQKSVTDESQSSLPRRKEKRRGRSPARLSSLVKDLYYYPDSLKSGHTTPREPEPLAFNEDYIPRPERYRVSGLSAQHLLERLRSYGSRVRGDSSNPSRSSSVSSYRSRNSSLMNLVEASSNLGSWAAHDAAEQASSRPSRDSSPVKRPSLGRRRSAAESILETFGQISRKRGRPEDVQSIIKKHTEDTEERQRYLLRLCKAFLIFGAPTHRLESLMDNSAKDLAIDAQFYYLPGCMLVSFDDRRSRTTQVKLVKAIPGLDLGKMGDTYTVYKDIFHDDLSPREAADKIESIIERPTKYKTWFLVCMYGLASLSVGPFAFEAQWLDLPIAFVLGCIMGVLKVVWAPRSVLYTNVFEIVSVLLTSFLSRWMGSIANQSVICFSNLAQSSIAMILPGFTVLVGILELQSRSLIAGSARVMYAVIYSITLGFAMTAGLSLYGLMHHNAASEPFCRAPIPTYYFPVFVSLFSFAVMTINLAKWGQMPVMMFISCIGYAVSFGLSRGLDLDATISAGGAALVIGFLANLYGRIGYQVDRLLNTMGNWIRKKLGRRSHSVMSEKGPQLFLSEDSTPSSDGEDHQQRFGRRHQSSILQRARRSIERSMREKRGGDPEDLEAGDMEEPKRSHKKATNKVSYTLAAATMMPAILVQVPSGISATGSLVSGIQAANEISGNATEAASEPSVNEIVQGITYNNVSFTVGFAIIQVAIGITAGLFIGSILIYPRGKDATRARTAKNRQRGGLFSF